MSPRDFFTVVSVAVFVVGGVAYAVRGDRDPVAKPATPSTGLHIYLAHGDRLVYLCQSSKPIQQVINCDNGESVLLTADLANELVLSTKELNK